MHRPTAVRATLEALHTLIDLACTGADLCQQALKRSLLPDATAELARLCEDHRRHLSSLLLVLDTLGQRLGVRARWRPRALELQPPASDVAFLEALAETTSRARSLSEALLADPELPATVRGVVAGNLSNGHVHASWLLARLVSRGTAELGGGAPA